jgi:putative DNA primase/helicase
MIFIGPGGNGKSTLERVLLSLLGAENCSSQSIQDLITNRFAIAELHGKLANICADINRTELKSTAKLKGLTGNDLIRAEKKNQHPFQFINHAKLTFSANALPVTPDLSRAYFRRILLVPFVNIFEGTNEDKNLLSKLTTPEELSGILNWALIGLQRLLTNGDFSNVGTVDEMQHKYELMSDPTTAFLEQCVEIDVDGIETKDDFYNAYCHFCHSKGFPAQSNITFSKQLHNQLQIPLIESRPSSKDRKMCWRGVQLRCQECQGCQACSYRTQKKEISNAGKTTLDTFDTLDKTHVHNEPDREEARAA